MALSQMFTEDGDQTADVCITHLSCLSIEDTSQGEVMKKSAPSVTFTIRHIRSPAFVRRLWVVEEFLKRRPDDS